jgi:hypothetical protein
MARRRKRKKRSMKLGDEFTKIVAGVQDGIKAEMLSVMSKVAKNSEAHYRRELTATGLRPSSETGTKDKQSNKLKGRPSHNYSMFDIVSGVQKLGNKFRATAGSEHSWTAAFWNNNSDHHNWGSSSHMTLDELGFNAENWIDHAMKSASADAKDMISKGFEKAINQEKNKRKGKRNG